MEIIESKTGNGAFSVARDGAKVIVAIADSPARTFMSVQHAYDWCRDSYADLQGTMRGYSYLNAAYALEDMANA
jgi:hypothetical protein